MIAPATTDPRRPTLSVVAPCYNESEALDAFVEAMLVVLDELGESFELILVDDGSRDGTFEIIRAWSERRPEICGLQLSRNFGHQAALTAGIDVACGAAVITMDSDLQHPPELIPQLVATWRDGVEVVLTKRRPNGHESAFKRGTSAAYYRLISKLSKIELEEGTSDFRLLDARVVTAFRRCRESHRLLRGLAVWVGFRKAVVPFDVRDRIAGRSKYTITRMVGLALDGMFSFSTAPLRAAILVGLATSVLAVSYLAVILTIWIVRPELVEPGWTSVIGAVLLIGGVQLTFLGVVGEYIGKIFQEVKQRPLYLVRQSIPDRELPEDPPLRDRVSHASEVRGSGAPVLDSTGSAARSEPGPAVDGELE